MITPSSSTRIPRRHSFFVHRTHVAEDAIRRKPAAVLLQDVSHLPRWHQPLPHAPKADERYFIICSKLAPEAEGSRFCTRTEPEMTIARDPKTAKYLHTQRRKTHPRITPLITQFWLGDQRSLGSRGRIAGDRKHPAPLISSTRPLPYKGSYHLLQQATSFYSNMPRQAGYSAVDGHIVR